MKKIPQTFILYVQIFTLCYLLQQKQKNQKISFLIPLSNETIKEVDDGESSNTIKYTKLSIYENQIERSEAFIVLDKI